MADVDDAVMINRRCCYCLLALSLFDVALGFPPSANNVVPMNLINTFINLYEDGVVI